MGKAIAVLRGTRAARARYLSSVPVLPATPDAIRHAAAVLRAGGLVAFPTETVYGLGADALDPAAVGRIFAAKGRPNYNPLIVHATDVHAVQRLVTRWPAAAQRLAERFWPGPLTLVLPRASVVPDAVTAGLGSVAVRIPAHPVALALLREAGIPVAAPSANRFTELSPTTASHVASALGDRVDLILDGGATEVGIESTVLDLTGAVPVVLRPGMISLEALSAEIGDVLPASALPAAPIGEAPRASPGMMDRHYAPRAELTLFHASQQDQVRAWAARAAARGERVGVLLRAPRAGTHAAAFDTGIARALLMPADPAGYARRLYAALHELDEAGCRIVYVEHPPDDDAWAGVRDRLRRGAAGEVGPA